MFVSKDLSLKEFEQVMKEIINEREEAERKKEAALETGVSDTESVDSADRTNTCPMNTVNTTPLHWKRNISADTGSTDAASIDSMNADSDCWSVYLEMAANEFVSSPIPNFNDLSIEGSDSQPILVDDSISMQPILLEKFDKFVDLTEVMCKHPELYSIPLIGRNKDEVQNKVRIDVANFVNLLLNEEQNRNFVYPGSWFIERAGLYQLRVSPGRRVERYPLSSLTTSSVPDELAGYIPTLEEFLARRLVPWEFARSLIRPSTLSKEELESKVNFFKKFTSEVNKGHCVVSIIRPQKSSSVPSDNGSGGGSKKDDRSDDGNGNQGDRHNGDAGNKSSGSGKSSSSSKKRTSNNGNTSIKKQRQHSLGVQGMNAQDELEGADNSENDSEDGSEDEDAADDEEEVGKEQAKAASRRVETDVVPTKVLVAAESSVADEASNASLRQPLKVNRQLYPASPIPDHRGSLRKEEV